jgi:hypothetical protein
VKVLWFDPGGTTGWAIFSCQETNTPWGLDYSEMKFYVGELVGNDHHHKISYVMELEHTDQDFTVGFESWEMSRNDRGEARDKVDWMACEYIGAIKLSACIQNTFLENKFPVVSQTPSERKFADQRKMQIFGLWSSTVGFKDGRSAAQHLLTYLIKTKKYPPVLKRLEEGLNA